MEQKLTYFYNIGDIQAKKILNRLFELNLINNDNISKYSINDIRKILLNKKIFNELSEATKQDLIYQPLRIIPRPIISLINTEFTNLFKNILHFDICGSYIRMKNTSSDIDLVLETSKENVWDFFMNTINDKSQYIYLHKPYARGNDKVSVIIEVNLLKSGLLKMYPDFKCKKVNVKMDVFLTTKEDYIFAKLFAIGSGIFNIRMRYLAKRKNFLLNNHGLFKKDTMDKIPLKTEKEIFEILGIKYKEPKDRIK